MKEKVKNFIVFYHQQEIGERRRIRDEFLRESRMTYPAWYAKLHREVFSALELAALGKICGKCF